MKKAVSIVCLVLAMVMIISTFASCGESLDGTYKIVKLIDGDDSISGDDYLERTGSTMTLTISGTSATLGYSQGAEFLTVNPDTQTLSDDKGDAMNYTLDGNTLSLSKDDVVMVFEKE